MKKTYKNDDDTWKKIQAFLPEAMRFTETFKPKEDWFQWRNSNIHIDRFENPDAPFRVILHHGVGTNGRLLSLIAGGPLAKNGYDVASVDMPLYGMTENNEKIITYDDWVKISDLFIRSEIERDGKPVVLYGLSAGGMLCYHVACINDKIKGIIGMCFLNLQDPEVNRLISKVPLLDKILPPATHASAFFPGVRGIKLPMKWVSKMSSLMNNPEALKILLKDKYSAGASISFKFGSTFMSYRPEIPFDEFDRCPVLLTQPDDDRWTPIAASQKFMDQLHVKKRPPRRAETKPISNGCPSTFFEYTFAIKGGAK
jgi:alpha-beta hydrolase superfamily lysophospholipase